MSKVSCQYIKECTSANTEKCESCIHNKNKETKKDWYYPAPTPLSNNTFPINLPCAYEDSSTRTPFLICTIKLKKGNLNCYCPYKREEMKSKCKDYTPYTST